MESTNWLLAIGFIAVLAAVLTTRRALMGQLEDLQTAVADARTAIEADKQAIIAEIQRLGLPDQDISGVLASVQSLGTVLDDVPGVTPATPPVDEVPTDEVPTDEVPTDDEGGTTSRSGRRR